MDRAARNRDGWWRDDNIAISTAFLLWLVPSLPFIWQYGGPAGAIILPGAGLLALIAFTRFLRRRTVDISVNWLIAACGLLLVLFAWRYFLAHGGPHRTGSDRDDALNVALHDLTHLNLPYRARTYLGNPITPMPGALMLALPFYLLGNSALQNFFWVPVFIWWSRQYLGTTRAALWCVLIFVLGCPQSLYDFVTGGDYLVNALYVAVAMDLVFLTMKGERRCHLYAAAIFLGIAISSRPIYAFAAIIMAGAIFRAAGRMRLLEFAAIVAATCAVVNGPLFLADPSHFPISPQSRMISSFPTALHAATTIPLLGALIGCCGFVMDMNRPRIFGLMALALTPIFYIVILYRLASQSNLAAILEPLGFSLPVSIFGALWLSHQLFGKQDFAKVSGP